MPSFPHFSYFTTMTFRQSIRDNCAICLCTITDPRWTFCGHIFCAGCLVMCKDNKCPTCRGPIVINLPPLRRTPCNNDVYGLSDTDSDSDSVVLFDEILNWSDPH
jgi:hypothetical protein